MTSPPLPTDLSSLHLLPLGELMARALAVKLERRGPSFSFCSILNAKSGRCSEDCRFCAQSSRYQTDAPVYPLRSKEEVVAAAHEAKRNGASRFSLVTSGRGLSMAEVEQVAERIVAIRAEVGIAVCASLGILDEAALRLLVQAGLSRYHHNLEASREYFPQVCTSHSFEERLATIRAAHSAGLSVCSGGILGLGETEEDRISMAVTLAECGVESVPLNILIPLPGTPFADHPPLPVGDILKAIALYRLILPHAAIRLAAGRESALAEFLSSAFLAGADGMMIGGYLTQRGRDPEVDLRFASAMRTLWSM